MKTPSSGQLLFTFVPSIAVLVVAVFMSIFYGVNIRDMTNEGGVLSNLGIILWCAAASVCLFTAITLHNNKQATGVGFLYYSAFLTAYLLLDDFFQIHEVIFPHYLGLDEKIVYIILIIAVITYLIEYRRLILQTNYIFFLLALGFLGSSVASDGIFASLEVIYAVLGIVIAASFYFIVFKQDMFRAYWSILLLITGLCAAFIIVDSMIDNPEYLLEDGTKWLGIACWCSYYVHTSYQFIIGVISGKNNDQEVYLEAELPVRQ